MSISNLIDSRCVAIIILNYCTADNVIKNVNQLTSFNKPYHIIVVDNKSPDGSFLRLRNYFANYHQIDILQTDNNLGYAGGNNFGIDFAIKQYNVDTLVIMNPDVYLPCPEVLTNLCSLLYSEKKCIFAGGCPINQCNRDQRMPMGWDIPNCVQLVSNSCLFLDTPDWKHQRRCVPINSKITRVECVAGCLFATKTSLFQEIGMFDEGTFLYNEENILGIKARQYGYYGLIDKSIIYYHNHAQDKGKESLRTKIKSIDIGFSSRIYMARKYFSKMSLPFLYLAHWLNKLFLFLAWFLHRCIIGDRK